MPPRSLPFARYLIPGLMVPGKFGGLSVQVAVGDHQAVSLIFDLGAHHADRDQFARYIIDFNQISQGKVLPGIITCQDISNHIPGPDPKSQGNSRYCDGEDICQGVGNW